MESVIPEGVWPAVAERLQEHVGAGRTHLLTEDVLRFSTISVLETHGVRPERLAVEWIIPNGLGKIDLVVDHPPTAAIEFKFPRDSRTGISPDTMTLGELLNDVWRLATLDIRECLAVQLIGDRLRGYLERRTDVPWMWDPDEELSLTSARLARLPETSRRSIHNWDDAARAEVIMRCVESHSLPGLTLTIYSIAPGQLSPQIARETIPLGEGETVSDALREEIHWGDLESAFHRGMVGIYDRAREQAGYNATRFIRMVSEHGGLKTAQLLLAAESTSEGFASLWERKRLDLTVEYLVLSRRFAALFNPDERQRARQRLLDHGMPADRLPG